MDSFTSAKITLWMDRIIMGLLAVLALVLPWLLRWYAALLEIGPWVPRVIGIAFYCCLPAVVLALWSMDRLMRNILAGEVFVEANVSCIRRVRWCCLAVSLISLCAGWFYPPLVFLFAIMGFLALVVNVVGQVMKAAVAIREENDLTV